MDRVQIQLSDIEPWGRPSGPAWRLCWTDDEGHEWVSTLGFGRRRDAEMALRALIVAGFTFEDLDNGNSDGTEDEMDRVMIEALQW